MVLTHGEPHPGNTLMTNGGWVVVDWDTTLIAERDLRNNLQQYLGPAARWPQP